MHTHFLFIFSTFFTFLFFYFLAGPSSAHVAGLDPAGLAGSQAQASDPAGQKSKKARVKEFHACMNRIEEMS